jgi:hypothetical protein
VCLFHRLGDGIWLCKLDQINADPKGQWYQEETVSRLYVDQSAKLRLDQGETRSVKIRREVRNAVYHHFYSICAANTLQRSC